MTAGAESGLTGWGWDDVLPYFRKLEGHHRGGNLHGQNGPLRVSAGESDSPFNQAVDRRGPAGGIFCHRRFQRRATGGVRPLRPDDRRRPALHGRGSLSGPRPRPPEPHRRHRCPDDPHPAGRWSCRRDRLRRRPHRTYRRTRGPKCWSPPARCSRRSCCNCPASATPSGCARRVSRRCTICPVSAKTCRTISTSS